MVIGFGQYALVFQLTCKAIKDNLCLGFESHPVFL